MPRSGPAFDDLDSSAPALSSAGPKRPGLNGWPEPPWRYQVLAVVLILLGLGAMTLAGQ